MHLRITFASLTLVALVPALVGAWACSNNPAQSSDLDASDDAGLDAETEGGDDSPLDTSLGPDTPDNACTLSDHVTDPVALCTQEQVLRAELQYAYVKGKGVAPGWSSVAPYAGTSPHSWQDALGLAGALGAYLCSASVSGNNN